MGKLTKKEAEQLQNEGILTEEAMNESLAREAESNGEIPVQRQVAYLRGETNNIEEVSNANINS